MAVSAASLIIGAQAALAQKAGGILKIYNRDSPPSMSILEESQGVRWQDGQPLTAQDVKCIWDLLTGNESAPNREPAPAGVTTLIRRRESAEQEGPDRRG